MVTNCFWPRKVRRIKWCFVRKTKAVGGFTDVQKIKQMEEKQAEYSKIGFQRTQGLGSQPVGDLIFQNKFCSYSTRQTNDTCALSRKRPKVRERTKFVEMCKLVAENARWCTCELCRQSNVEADAPGTGLVVSYTYSIIMMCIYALMKIVLNPKIPAWHVLKFGAFSSLSVLP